MYKGLSILLLFVLFSTLAVRAQQPGKKRTSIPAKKPPVSVESIPEGAKTAPTPEDAEPDRTSFDKAVAAVGTADKARLLRAFLAKFPDSELRPEAYTYLVTARAIVGSEKVKAGEISDGIASFKLAVEEAPDPV